MKKLNKLAFCSKNLKKVYFAPACPNSFFLLGRCNILNLFKKNALAPTDPKKPIFSNCYINNTYTLYINIILFIIVYTPI